MIIRVIIVLFLLALVIIHGLKPVVFQIDWPSVALLTLAITVIYAHKLQFILPFVKRLKVGQAEIELVEKTVELFQEVEKSETTTPAQPVAENDTSLQLNSRILDTSLEAQILDLAAKDKEAALVRLSIEIERELYLLHGNVGLRNNNKVRNFPEIVSQLTKHGTLSPTIEHTIMSFRKVRNEIVHASQKLNESVLNSTLDSGLRIFRLIKSIPRQTYKVIRIKVPLYKDSQCKQLIENTTGVILETTRVDGTKYYSIFPAGREFTEGEYVGWDWDMKRVCEEAYYMDINMGQPTVAWSSSAFFIGETEKH